MKTKDLFQPIKVPVAKPRNPIVAAAVTKRGAGPMKDKKTAAKRGYQKYPCKLDESDLHDSDKSGFISVLMAARTHAHILHLAEKSFARHLALDELYSGLSEKLDAIAEFLMGSGFDVQPALVPIKFSNDPVEFVTALLTLVNNTPIGDLASNDFDELVAIIAKTKYKLERLS